MESDNSRDSNSTDTDLNQICDIISMTKLAENLFNNDDLDPGTIVESEQSNTLPYPKRVFFIIGNEFCERFNYFGMKAILVLYMTKKLMFDEKIATIYFHTFTMMVYFTSIFGGILSDVWLGKFKTILYLSIVYCFGSLTIVAGSIPHLNIPSETLLLIGLIVIAIGNGGIKPCVSSFAGDQFVLPEQSNYMDKFFSLFYASISAGSLISTSVTPMLRAKFHCFGEDDCYPLAFGVPAILMIVAIALFLFGKSSYTMSSPSENVLAQVGNCIVNAIVTKRREIRTQPREHFLDYSIEKFGLQLVDDTKRLLSLITLFLPLSMFWALTDQQGSSWVIQATKMNGDLGFYTILPDQMHALSSILLLIFIPLCDYILYPLLSKIGFSRPLQKLTMSGFLAAIAILMSAFVEWRIQAAAPNSLSILWQAPQIAVMTLGDVMFYVTGLAFAYEQAPKYMKSVVQSFWLLTIGFGNAIIAIVTELSIFESQIHEFLLFSGLMIVDMLIFIMLARKFKSVQTQNQKVKN